MNLLSDSTVSRISCDMQSQVARQDELCMIMIAWILKMLIKNFLTIILIRKTLSWGFSYLK